MNFDVLYRRLFIISLHEKINNKTLTLNEIKDLYFITAKEIKKSYNNYTFQENLAYHQILTENGFNFCTKQFNTK